MLFEGLFNNEVPETGDVESNFCWKKCDGTGRLGPQQSVKSKVQRGRWFDEKHDGKFLNGTEEGLQTFFAGRHYWKDF